MVIFEQLNKKLNVIVVLMKTSDFLLKLAKAVFPKSRWGNVAYLVLGVVISNWDNITKFVKELIAAFSS